MCPDSEGEVSKLVLTVADRDPARERSTDHKSIFQ